MSAEDPATSHAIDRRRVARSFDRAATSYDAEAQLQTAVRDELLGRLGHFALAPRVTIDLGCGTGAATPALAQRYPGAQTLAVDSAPAMLAAAGQRLRPQDRWLGGRFGRPFTRVCADAARLPLAGGSVQLVFSSLMLQWSEDLDATLREARRVLAEDGVIFLSTFGPNTLRELRSAWAEVDDHVHVNAFVDLHDLGQALARAGFAEPVLDVDHHLLTYPDAFTLMRSLKAIGAHNIAAGRPRGLTSRARIKRMVSAYQRFRLDDGLLPATWEVIYVTAFAGKQASRPSPPRREIAIPATDIGRRRVGA